MQISFNIDEELKKCKTIEELTGKNGLFKRMLKEITEQILDADLKVNEKSIVKAQENSIV
ncbi:ISCpe3, transposase [Candidatus Omnitrophus magneticus]|uniref:ISCpe3, transposase n=1 Tax=Candidatus Omnitrophus magneticus TaxID=1609969 RepID=A0A0F0CNJ9_9BACT|nr:ISCpe3, transposase [Candidatus Omnitrophus magneticus]KJJ84716.1 ISCpe3, transposase [Candidatus Omnitrophus magneticus]KJJ84980.1 ISCpe3, transposase [Candidatus Omnitrophus magneticus]